MQLKHHDERYAIDEEGEKSTADIFADLSVCNHDESFRVSVVSAS